MSKLNEIMAVVKKWAVANVSLGPHLAGVGELEAQISAILNRPQVVEVDGVEWVPQQPSEYQHLKGDDLWTVDGESCLWSVRKNAELVCAFSDLTSALTAASAAIKEEK